MISRLQGPVVLCSVVFLITAYIMNIYWRNSLFYDGLEFIKVLQQSIISSPSAIFLNNVFSLLCSSKVKIVALAVLAILTKRKLALIVLLTFFVANVYLNSLSKLLFSDPRPFWYSTEIYQLEWKCPGQFGNPSGHSRSAAFLYYLIIADFAVGRRRLGGVWWVAIISIWALVPFSRLALGAHSSNQVIFGMLIGLAWLVIYRYGLQQWMHRGLCSLMQWKQLWQLAIILASYCFAILFPIVSYQIVLKHLVPQRFISNMLVGCPHAKANTALKILNGTFVNCGSVGIVFGVLLGIWWVSRATNYHLYLLGRWTSASSSWLAMLFRIAVEIIPAALVACIVSMLLPQFVTSVYLKYAIVHLATLSFGFLAVYVPANYLERLGLIDYENYSSLAQRH